jgi:hypothetical protein
MPKSTAKLVPESPEAMKSALIGATFDGNGDAPADTFLVYAGDVPLAVETRWRFGSIYAAFS